MHVLEIRPEGAGWRLAAEGEADGLNFPAFAQAERRARWLAVRHEVGGLAAEIHVLDAAGGLVGVWCGERYTSASVARAEPRSWVDADAA